MRSLDDKIIYTFNKAMPTDSFKQQFDGTSICKTLHDSVSFPVYLGIGLLVLMLVI